MTALIVVTFFVLLFLALFLKIEYGREFNTALVSAACTVTGCSKGGIALFGWLTTFVAPLYVAAAVRWWSKWPLLVRCAWGVVAVLLCMTSVQFMQLDYDSSLVALSAGPGGPALLHGIQWGIGAWCAATGVLFLWWLVTSIVDRKFRPRAAGAAFAVVLLTGGGVAYATAPVQVTYLMTTQFLPDGVLRAQGDVLTRTSATDLVGCGGRYAGCVRTAELDYTTDDSDATVRLEIVTFPHADAAWAALRKLPGETGDPGTIRVADVTSVWMVVSTIRHADGRVIQTAEERWLRWPARQLEWAFRDSLGYRERTPSPSDISAPRTP